MAAKKTTKATEEKTWSQLLADANNKVAAVRGRIKELETELAAARTEEADAIKVVRGIFYGTDAPQEIQDAHKSV